jgi:hypothetical protein
MVKAKLMKCIGFHAVPLFVCIAVLTGSAPARAAEVLFKGSGITLSSAFSCAGETHPAGKYDLAAFYEPQPNESTHLQVFKGRKTICEVKGTSTVANGDLSSSKVRLLSRVNDQMQSIQIDLVLPSAIRERIHNQVFYLPLPAKN